MITRISTTVVSLQFDMIVLTSYLIKIERLDKGKPGTSITLVVPTINYHIGVRVSFFNTSHHTLSYVTNIPVLQLLINFSPNETLYKSCSL